jgi:hypothetical protein
VDGEMQLKSIPNIKNNHMKFKLLLFIVLLISIKIFGQNATAENWNFVCIPDFLNKDTKFPHPGFEDGLEYFLKTVKNENPEFVLVPGDLVNGRWPTKLEPTKEAILENSDIYYSAWKNRFEHHGLKYYPAIGDHEIGDNPWPPNKVELVPLFKKQFVKHFSPPLNGPEGFLGTSYYWVNKGVLFISLDVFTEGKGDEGGIIADVNGNHLKWLNNILKETKDIKYKVVMGHTPILGPVNKLHSSGMMLEKGRDSELWEVLCQNKVDLYLCGEVHAITYLEENGVHQIAHGSLFGWNPTVNYLLVEVKEDQLKCTLKEIDNIPIREGRKSLGIKITEESKKQGFREIGELILKKSEQGTRVEKTGCFNTN